MFDLFNELSETKETEKKGSEFDVEKLSDIVAEKVLKKLSVTEPPKKEEPKKETKEDSKEETKEDSKEETKKQKQEKKESED